jgi:hypothetical protein
MEGAESFDSLWVYCTAAKRLVPMPPQWAEIHGMLKGLQQKPNGGWEPAAPLILAAWHCTVPLEKQLRFKEHIEWARDHDQVLEVGRFLRNLPEQNWAGPFWRHLIGPLPAQRVLDRG